MSQYLSASKKPNLCHTSREKRQNMLAFSCTVNPVRGKADDHGGHIRFVRASSSMCPIQEQLALSPRMLIVHPAPAMDALKCHIEVPMSESLSKACLKIVWREIISQHWILFSCLLGEGPFHPSVPPNLLDMQTLLFLKLCQLTVCVKMSTHES